MTPDMEKGRRFLAAHGPAHVLQVGVTGAHSYGFPSPDSDLDLKGIHLAPTAAVVSLDPPQEAIDFLGIFEELEIDYTSHELAAALRLLLRGNGNILERILSPFQLVDSSAATRLRELARGALSKKFFHHYRGFFGRMCAEWRTASAPTVKGILYAYRSALTGIHLLRAGECVGDVTLLAPLYGFDRVPELVALKACGPEHGPLANSGAFDDDLARLEGVLDSAHLESALPEQATNRDEIDRFLVDSRREHFS
jgi:predicted nucleotidyltransferase